MGIHYTNHVHRMGSMVVLMVTIEISNNGNYREIGGEDLREKIKEYFEKMDTVPTREWCTCPWIIHPDDHNVEEGKRRMRRQDTDDLCPIHSREGMLLYFFAFVMEA